MKKFNTGVILLIGFAFFSILVLIIDVRYTGIFLNGEQLTVGMGTLNKAFNGVFGFNEFFYNCSEILGILALCTAFIFAVFFLIRLIKKRGLQNTDQGLKRLMFFYVILVLIYVLFDKFMIINYRPVIMNGVIKSSYPSSHTLLGIFVFLSAVPQIKKYIASALLQRIIVILCYVFAVLSALTRLLSGVHWLTDIAGSVILSLSLVYFYCGEYD